MRSDLTLFVQSVVYEGCFEDPSNGRSAFDDPGQFADGN
jgi:hypothetical protein